MPETSTHSLVRSLIAACIATVAVAVTASADTITFVPTEARGNAFPFGYVGYFDEYQQVYRAGAFPSAITLRSATFTASPEFVSQPGIATTVTSSLSLGLSTTDAGPTSLRSRFHDNRGPNFVRVFTGVVTGVGAEPFSFRIAFDTPFVYRPSAGNLLLDVFINGNVTPDARPFAFAFGPSPDMGRVFHEFGSGESFAGVNEGLLTRFEGTAPVPEPGTLLLFATGGAAIVRRAWKGKALSQDARVH
ncbi:MAG: PEP-CTERM sorting domain-containing protein [Acidobacteriota bacterium]|nr:PEP-CTERM sorting domain-containing protein [Acidobacteriota bacterium]